MRALCARAVDVAIGAGAGYADARAVERRSQSVSTRNGRVDSVDDAETAGIGVRVLVDGAWGFACDRRLDEVGAREAALRAVEFARASGHAAGDRRVELAPLEAQRGEYRAPAERDPVEVPLGEKVELCLRAEEGLRHPEIPVTAARVRALRERRSLLSSEGTDVFQELFECGGGIEATAIRDGLVQPRSYPSAHVGSSAQAGWEYVEELALDREAPRIAEEAVALLSAAPCPSEVTTVVIDAEQMQLQVHESVGHPTELDRVYGTEAAYAGTSFLQPGDLGSLRYGSEAMWITADPTTPRGLGTFAFDDEGVAAGRQPVVEAGVLTGFLGSRETSSLIGHDLARIDAGGRLEPDAARPDDEPAPRAGRGEPRRPALGGRRGHLPRHQPELVDRRQAAELPVRNAGCLGDTQGQPDEDAAGRGVHGGHAGVLGVARRRRRPRRVAHARPDELRKGSAGPACARITRRFSRTVSERSGRHRPMTGPLDLAERAWRAARADEAEALVMRERSGLARFAASRKPGPLAHDEGLRLVRPGRAPRALGQWTITVDLNVLKPCGRSAV